MSITSRKLADSLTVAGTLSAAFAVAVFVFTARSAGAAQNGAIPQLMLPYGSGWSGGIGGAGGLGTSPESYLPADYLNGPESIQAAIARGVPPDKVKAYLQIRTFGQYIPPASG